MGRFAVVLVLVLFAGIIAADAAFARGGPLHYFGRNNQSRRLRAPASRRHRFRQEAFWPDAVGGATAILRRKSVEVQPILAGEAAPVLRAATEAAPIHLVADQFACTSACHLSRT